MLYPTMAAFLLVLIPSAFASHATLPGFTPTLHEAAEHFAIRPEAEDGFGAELATDGATLLVANDLNPPPCCLVTGSTYVDVFERSDENAWVPVQRLELPVTDRTAGFGAALAVNGDVAVVGTPLDDERALNAGAAYVYERGPNGLWTLQQKLTAWDAMPHDVFGNGVATDGYRIVVGAPLDDLGPPEGSSGGPDEGSARVFYRNASGTWVETAILTASDGDLHGTFGTVLVWKVTRRS